MRILPAHITGIDQLITHQSALGHPARPAVER